MTKQNQNQTKRSLKPPYLSLSALENLLSLLSTRKLDGVTYPLLTNYGFGKSDAYTAIVALKFLGLLDEQEKTTEIAKKLHLQGEPREKALQEIVRSAYSKLFEVVAEPQNLSPQELRNEMIAQYSVTPRIARTAVPAFLWLCGKAGLLEEALKPRKRKSTTMQGNRTTAKPGISRGVSTSKGTPTTKLDVIRDVLTSMKDKDEATMTIVIQGLKDLLEFADEPKKDEGEDNEGVEPKK